ncbi:bifunctional riboflavin kinase/FAD synthetase [Auraticoccus monumenti]|uniref:Riboflavin biosynthesis protein n=1 Tax=Auraticoccus monumenti TaxID=675864 RepID=A0A1G7DA23_9ACTN|nr:bifunctional riboflavin kinase/FAD synthetase [Auraticoccus monumenti]SDE47756.1 FMN adenylyltransferase /riboflavin kinase [Auraticoccus monumenti]
MSTSAVVIGTFDGVHTGHRRLLELARAREPGARVVAVTFWPHPVSVVRPGAEPKLLSDPIQRELLLRDAGADEVVVVPFSTEVSRWSPAEFVDRVLRPLEPVRVLVGEGFTFGHRASGSATTLAEELGEGVVVESVPLARSGGAPASSTRIRAALAEGDVALANSLLGRPYCFRGVVVVGDQRGREMGFPTANLLVPESMAVPADGIYAGWLTVPEGPDAGRHAAAISVGTNPTFDGVQRRVEANVIGRTDLQLYGLEVVVEFTAWIRGQVRYTGVEDLVTQIHLDVARIREILGA